MNKVQLELTVDEVSVILAISPLILCFVIGLKMCINRFKNRQDNVKRVLKLVENLEDKQK
jgi:hypothetical protein